MGLCFWVTFVASIMTRSIKHEKIDTVRHMVRDKGSPRLGEAEKRWNSGL